MWLPVWIVKWPSTSFSWANSLSLTFTSSLVIFQAPVSSGVSFFSTNYVSLPALWVFLSSIFHLLRSYLDGCFPSYFSPYCFLVVFSFYPFQMCSESFWQGLQRQSIVAEAGFTFNMGVEGGVVRVRTAYFSDSGVLSNLELPQKPNRKRSTAVRALPSWLFGQKAKLVPPGSFHFFKFYTNEWFSCNMLKGVLR